MLNTIIETTIITLIAIFVLYIPVFIYCKGSTAFDALFFIKNFLVSAISALVFVLYYLYTIFIEVNDASFELKISTVLNQNVSRCTQNVHRDILSCF